LVNGHRLAPADLYGNFIDLSMIPLTAVERIDVVTDGASAIYGSDAVGGVVNIITRQDFDGAETRARFGSDTHNDVHESQVGQTLGQKWGSGSALLTYEFYDRTPLDANDRSFTALAPLPFTLLPEQVRQSVFATLNQSINPDLSIYSDAMFSHRSTHSDDTVLGSFQDSGQGIVNEYGVVLGGDLAVSATTNFEFSGDYSTGDAVVRGFNYPETMPAQNDKATSEVATGEGVLSGPLWSLPAGPIRYALGVQYRRESFDAQNFVANTRFEPDRNVFAGFVEARVPILSSSDPSWLHGSLDLSLADREEHYSDFGSTNNPTIGLIWSPLKSLKFRGTYGTSFVAPLLSDTNPTLQEVAGFNTTQVPGSTPPGSGTVNELIEFGGNPDLKAQTATTWTVGADWQSSEATGLKAHVNYYDIRFRDRIADLQSSGYSVWTALTMANIFGPQIVTVNPPASLVQSLVSSPSLENFGANLNDIGAVIDSRSLNLSEVNTNGIDFSSAYRSEVMGWALEPGIDASYVLHLQDRFTSTSPLAEIVNTLYNPTRVRARGHMTVSRKPFSVSGFVNFVSSYKNNYVTPPVNIASWTTVDLSAAYSCETCSGILSGFTATLAATNVLNRAPPYAKNPNDFAINYDGANANPLGRFYSLEIGMRW
jgi:outer membrane receptor protein involved in Fe transport